MSNRKQEKLKLYRNYLRRKNYHSKELHSTFKYKTDKKKIRNWQIIILKFRKYINAAKFSSIEEVLKYKDQLHHDFDFNFACAARERPPEKICKLILAGLLEIYENWIYYLEKSNLSFVIQIILFENDVSGSQVFFSFNENYEITGNMTHNKNKPLPNYYQMVEMSDHEPLKWVYYKYLGLFSQSELDDEFTLSEIDRLLKSKKLWMIEKTLLGEKLYNYHFDNYWLCIKKFVR